jgi:hypothetical protein
MVQRDNEQENNNFVTHPVICECTNIVVVELPPGDYP